MITNVEAELEMTDRHLTVLRQVFQQGPIGIVALSDETGYPKHKVRYSLRILEENGLVEPTDHGAVVTDQATAFVDTVPDRFDDIISRLERLKAATGSVETTSNAPVQ